MAGSKWAQRIAGLSFAGLVGAGLVASSCAEAEGRFIIECSLKPGECADCEGAEQALTGQYNVAGCLPDGKGGTRGTCGYDAQFVVRNQMVSSLTINANHNDVETSKIIVTSADISFDTDGQTITGVNGETLLGEIEPDNFTCLTASNLFGGVDLAEQESLNVIMTLKIYGRTTGGLDVETPTQYFAVSVYNDPNDCTCEDIADSLPGIDGAPIACADCP